MELVIAGGIALLGYATSTPGRAPRERPGYAAQLGPSNEYLEPGNDTGPLGRDFVARAEKQWAAARDPALTGVITPHTKLTNAQLPFFRSARSQNTNDAVKQTRMEAFTGATAMGSSATGTYRNKREVEAMFSPSYNAQRVTSSGTAGNDMARRDTARYTNSQWHNNVLPAEQIRVGRGVGVGPDVPAADGFHPMYRLTPKNVGEYKKNNLPGRTLGGASRVTRRTRASRVSVNRHPGALVTTQDQRPMMRGMAAVTARAVYPEPEDPGQRPRPMDLDRFGNPAYATGPETRGARENRLGYGNGACGDNPDRNHVLPTLNLTGAAAGVGGYPKVVWDRQRFDSQQRETAGREGFLTGPVARRLPSGHLLPATQREMTPAAPMGGIGVVRSSGEVRKQDAAKTTLREGYQGATALTGTKAAVLGGTLDNVWRYKRLDREAKRADQLVERVTGPARINVLNAEGMGQMALRERDETQPHGTFLPDLPNKGYQIDSGRGTVVSNKLPSANPRLDLGMAADQLRDNPYARPLWKE